MYLRHYLTISSICIFFFMGCAQGPGNDPNLVNSVVEKFPNIVSADPPDGAQQVLMTSVVQVTFDKSMDEGNMKNAFLLQETLGGVVDGNVVVNEMTVVFTPTSPLKSQTSYIVIIASSATDSEGQSLAGSLFWSFTTGI